MTFKECYEYMLQKRELQKAENPILLEQTDGFLTQIYSNSPLQFNIWARSKSESGFVLQFCEQNADGRIRFTVTARNSEGLIAKKVFSSDEDIQRIVEVFPVELPVMEIVEYLLTL